MDKSVSLDYADGIAERIWSRGEDHISSKTMESSSNLKLNYAEIARNKSKSYLVVKRVSDIFLCLIAVPFLAIITIPISLAMIIEDGFPVFFIQKRIGKDGKVFRMFKFRSMCKDAQRMHSNLIEQNEQDGPAFKLKYDPRVTKVGKFLRRTSIDELPQIINIIKGDMSIVGPRPLPTYETADFDEYQSQRHLVKPGLTCYWQCNGRNLVPFDEWIQMDLKYIEEASVGTDLKIILKTVPTVLKKDGAY